MKMLNSTLLDVILLITPMLIYLLYNAYMKTIDKKEENLIFIVSVVTMYYFLFKYGDILGRKMPSLIVETPLILSYKRKSNSLIIISSVASIIYFASYYEKYLPLIVLEYLIYNLIFTKIKTPYLIVFKVIIISIYEGKITSDILSEGALLFTMNSLFTYLLNQAENMLKIHMNIKEIEEDKQIKKSLFQITHEIKNPIAVCKGYLDMYSPEKTDKIKKYIPIIKEEIDRTLILLEDFLSMNRQKINREILDINMLLEDITNNIKLLLKDNNIKLVSEIDEEEIYIKGDYNRLTQVFINIFKNSIEALENRKSPQIKIWTKQEDDNIKIYIKDNGSGISKEELEKIKEPFYTTKQKGTGLGVSLSDEIIKAHKGTLEYKSEKDKFTEVNIKLPLEKI